MNSVNRFAIVVTAREPFLTWARGIESTAPAAVVRTDFTSVYLVNETDEFEPEKLIRKHYKSIFVEFLVSWYLDETKWPKPRTEKMFYKWFDAKVVDLLWDLGRGPIVVEDL